MQAPDRTPTIDDALHVDICYQEDVPDSIRSLSSITDPDYLDVVTLAPGHGLSASAEQWARAALEETGGAAGKFLIWRVILGLRLGWLPSPARIAGWRIAAEGDNWVRLAAHSWMLTGNLIVRVDGEQVRLATIVRYDRPLARRIWNVLTPMHSRVSPSLMREGVAVVRGHH